MPPIGTIGLSKIGGITGLAVKLGQWISGDGSPWTHAFLVIDSRTVIEAAPGGVVYRPLSDYDGRAFWMTEWPTLDLEQQGQLQDEAQTVIGADYGWLQYPCLGLLALRIRPRLLRRYVARSDRYICSQLVDELHRRVGSHLFDDGRDSMDVTPGDLYRRYREVVGSSRDYVPRRV